MKRIGNRPPDRTTWRPWEDKLLRAHPPEEVARQTGRLMGADYGRRFRTGMTKPHKR
jgi:hypothetical protein